MITWYIIYLALSLMGAFFFYVFGYNKVGTVVIAMALGSLLIWFIFNYQTLVLLDPSHASPSHTKLPVASTIWEQGSSLGFLEDMTFHDRKLVIKTNEYLVVVKGVPVPLQRGAEVRHLRIGGKDSACINDRHGPVCFEM